MTYATPADIAVLLGFSFTPEQNQQAQGFLDDAEWQIKQRFPDLAERLAAGTVTIETLARVEVRAVRRIMLNPDGKDNEKIDDYSYGFNSDIANSEVAISDEEWSWLLPQGTPGESFSIKLGSSPRVTR